MIGGGVLLTLVGVVAASEGGGITATRAALPQRSVSQDSTYGCIVCHADKRRAFSQGVHAERGIRCEDCHGGDPSQYETPAAHRGRFVGSPTKRETVELCASCHSDPNQMRQYGLSVDQLAEFRTSRHGQLLMEQRNRDAPTCTDCHHAHLIRPASDARSEIYPSNIPGTCAVCHENASLMAKYGMPTDQLERFTVGAHGVAVFEKRNFAAPTCIGCHGSHAALPPAVAEITHVCGKCHVLLARAFYEGPHGEPAQAGGLSGCVGCHSNHGTERIPPEQIGELCTTCHDAESRMAAVGFEIEEQVGRAGEELAAAAVAIDEMAANGRETADDRFRYQAAFTAYQQLAKVQHSLDLEQLEELGREVRSNTGIIRATAEAYAEERWEHKLVLIPVWFLALSALVFAWFKLRELGR